MNKYQEALNILKENAYEYAEDTLDGEEWFLDYEPMDNVDEVAKPLQELVNKVTPMKPKYMSDPYGDELLFDTYICLNCEKEYFPQYGYIYCPNCGQKLDWSDCER